MSLQYTVALKSFIELASLFLFSKEDRFGSYHCSLFSFFLVLLLRALLF